MPKIPSREVLVWTQCTGRPALSAPSDFEMFNSRHVPDCHSWSVYNSDPRDERERAQYGLSLLINSERSLCFIWGNKTHLHESEPCLFSLLLCSLTPGRQFQSLSSYLLEISLSVIRFDIFWSCYSVHLIHFRKLRCRVRLGIVQQSSCIINEDTQHSASAVFLETSVCVWKFSKFYQVEDSVWDNFRKLDFHAIQHSYISNLLCIWKSLQCLVSSFGSCY